MRKLFTPARSRLLRGQDVFKRGFASTFVLNVGARGLSAIAIVLLVRGLDVKDFQAAGFQGGEQAVSIGYQRAISDRATVTVGGAFSDSESSAGVGMGFGW